MCIVIIFLGKCYINVNSQGYNYKLFFSYTKSESIVAGAGFPFPKYEVTSQPAVLPAGDAAVPQPSEFPFLPVTFPSTNAGHMVLPGLPGQALPPVTSSGCHPGFGNIEGIKPTDQYQLPGPHFNFPYSTYINRGHIVAGLGNASCKTDMLPTKNETRSVSPKLENKNELSQSKQVSPNLQDIPELRQENFAGNQHNFLFEGKVDREVDPNPPSFILNNNTSVESPCVSSTNWHSTSVHTSAPPSTNVVSDLSSGNYLGAEVHSRKGYNDDGIIKTEDVLPNEQNTNLTDSVPLDLASSETVLGENDSNNSGTSKSGESNASAKRGCKFIVMGKLARKTYYDRYRIEKMFIDSSVESPQDEAVKNYSSLISNLSLESSHGLFSYIQNLSESVYQANFPSFQSSPCPTGDALRDLNKEIGSASKRKARQPLFHSPIPNIRQDAARSDKAKVLNEEYLVKEFDVNSIDTSMSDGLSPDDKRAKQKTHPFAITSPSFTKAAARAVMTTSVANNATVVTISIANKLSGEKARTRSVSGPKVSMVAKEQHSDREEEDPFSDNGDNGEDQEETQEEVKTERVSIMSKLHATHDKEDARKSQSSESGIEESPDRMEINVRIDDSQMIQHGDIKRWQCHMCSKSYTTKHNLVTHILDHNGIKPHLCMVCGKYFKQLSHLNTHMLTHDNIKPHVCSVCGKGFTQISHLKRHQTVHQESRPYHCDICSRGFAYPSELRIHKERHSSEKENKCLDCGEEFDCQRALKQHQVTHGNCEELTCKYCKFVFPKLWSCLTLF